MCKKPDSDVIDGAVCHFSTMCNLDSSLAPKHILIKDISVTAGTKI